MEKEVFLIFIRQLIKETADRVQVIINFYLNPTDVQYINNIKIEKIEQRIEKKELSIMPYTAYLK